MQLASTSTPRSAINSVTCSYDSGYRRYKRTHKMINSPGCCRPLKGLVGVIGIDFYPTSMLAPEFATKPIIQSSGFVGALIASDLQQLVCVVNTGSGNDQTLEVAVGGAISEEYAIRRSLASRRSHPEV